MILLFAASAILLLAGVAVLQARSLVERPTDFSSQGALEAWQRTHRTFAFLGAILLDAGVFLFLLTGFLVGFLRSDLPESVRRSMIGMPVVLAVVWLLGFLLAGAFLSPFIP